MSSLCGGFDMVINQEISGFHWLSCALTLLDWVHVWIVVRLMLHEVPFQTELYACLWIQACVILSICSKSYSVAANMAHLWSLLIDVEPWGNLFIYSALSSLISCLFYSSYVEMEKCFILSFFKLFFFLEFNIVCHHKQLGVDCD